MAISWQEDSNKFIPKSVYLAFTGLQDFMVSKIYILDSIGEWAKRFTDGRRVDWLRRSLRPSGRTRYNLNMPSIFDSVESLEPKVEIIN